MSRIDKNEVSEALHAVKSLHREAKQANKAVAKLLGRLREIRRVAYDMPSPAHLAKVAQAADDLSSALTHAVHHGKELPDAAGLARIVRQIGGQN